MAEDNFNLTEHLAKKVEKLEWHIDELERKQKILYTIVIIFAVFLVWKYLL